MIPFPSKPRFYCVTNPTKGVMKLWQFSAWKRTKVMAVFDMAQHIVSGAAGVIGGDTNIDVTEALAAMQEGLKDMEIPELLLLVMETSLVSLCMKIMSVLITVILYGRMIEIYAYCSVSPKLFPFCRACDKVYSNSISAVS